MKQISGNKLLVKALKEEGVDVLFGYPGACTIDISDRLPVTSSETMRSRRLILSESPEASQNTVLPSATVRILDVSSRKLSISHAPDAQARFSSTFQRM